ncbi:hypothetical protein JP0183_04900 [Helicobacter pylori]
MPLTHLNEENQPKMVDIGDKETTERIALASGRISMNKEAYDAIINHCVKKGSGVADCYYCWDYGG